VPWENLLPVLAQITVPVKLLTWFKYNWKESLTHERYTVQRRGIPCPVPINERAIREQCHAY